MQCYTSVRNFIFGSLPIFLTNREWLSTKKSGSGSGVRIGSEKKSHSRFWLPIPKNRDREWVREWVREPFREWLFQNREWEKSHSRFWLPIPKNRDRESVREPFREWLFQNREWLSFTSRFLKKSLPKRLPNRLPTRLPNNRDREWEIGSEKSWNLPIPNRDWGIGSDLEEATPEPAPDPDRESEFRTLGLRFKQEFPKVPSLGHYSSLYI